MNSLNLWWHHVKTRLSMRLAYRTEFMISLLVMALSEFVGPILAFVIYQNSDGFVGWTFHQLILMQGIVMTIRGISFSTLMGMIWNSNHKILQGTFDILLIRPRNILWMFICDSFDSEDWIKIFGGVALIWYGLSGIGSVTLAKIGLALLSSLFGILFMFSFALLSSAFIFRFIQTWKLYEILDVIMTIAQYPKSIYSQGVVQFFSGILPVFVVSAVPYSALVGTFEHTMWLTLGSVAVFFGISLKIWYSTIQSYSSAGG